MKINDIYENPSKVGTRVHLTYIVKALVTVTDKFDWTVEYYLVNTFADGIKSNPEDYYNSSYIKFPIDPISEGFILKGNLSEYRVEKSGLESDLYSSDDKLFVGRLGCYDEAWIKKDAKHSPQQITLLADATKKKISNQITGLKRKLNQIENLDLEQLDGDSLNDLMRAFTSH